MVLRKDMIDILLAFILLYNYSFWSLAEVYYLILFRSIWLEWLWRLFNKLPHIDYFSPYQSFTDFKRINHIFFFLEIVQIISELLKLSFPDTCSWSPSIIRSNSVNGAMTIHFFHPFFKSRCGLWFIQFIWKDLRTIISVIRLISIVALLASTIKL